MKARKPLATTFSFGDQAANAVAQDLGSGSGEAVEAGLLQGFEHIVVAHFFQLGDVGDLGRAEGVELQVGVELFQFAEELTVVLQAEVRVVTALQQQLFAAEGEGLLDLGFVFRLWLFQQALAG